MERLNFKIALLAIFAVACTRLSQSEVAPWKEDEGANPVKSGSLMLKAGTDAASENVSAWLCTPNENYFLSGKSDEVEFTCDGGVLADIYMATNSAYSGSENPRDISVNLTDIAPSAIPCFGKLSKYYLEPGPHSIKLEVRRCIAKISFGCIENLISEPPYAGEAIIIDSLYIINGKGRFKVFCEDTLNSVQNWFMPSGAAGDASGQMKAPSISTFNAGGRTVSYKDSLDLNITLYTGPNKIKDDAFSGSGVSGWTPRKTRLVLSCRIGGRKCYYPLTIDKVTENTHYVIKKLTITRFGVSHPDLPFSFDELSVGYSIRKWESVDIEEII